MIEVQKIDGAEVSIVGDDMRSSGQPIRSALLGENVLAASNALACANMALANFDAVIPLDQVIETMDRVGKSLPVQLRCIALGGLSTTPTSKKIEQRLAINGKL